jgi:hypothetical protein
MIIGSKLMYMSRNVKIISNPSAPLIQETKQTKNGIHEGIKSLFQISEGKWNKQMSKRKLKEGKRGKYAWVRNEHHS